MLVRAVLEDDRRGAHRGDEGALRQGRRRERRRFLSVVVVVVVAGVSVLGDQLDLPARRQGRLVELVESVEERGPMVEVALLSLLF